MSLIVYITLGYIYTIFHYIMRGFLVLQNLFITYFKAERSITDINREI